MPRHPEAVRGFTFIEAVIAMAICGILIAIAVPAWTSAMAVVHARSVRAALLDSITEAIRHSTMTGSEVVLCASVDGLACSGTPDWSDGWLAYADIDGDRERAPRETLLRHQAALDGGVHLRSTRGRTRLVFQPNGGNAGSNVTFTLCDRRGRDRAVTLVLANNGRLRDGRPSRTAAEACVRGS